MVIGKSIKVYAKRTIYVSCFHKNKYETAFMWKQYADSDGIAIKTTLERLKRSFDKTEETISISDVQYIDYNSEFMPFGEFIDIDLNMLIEEIYISPYAASYIKENVELIANKFHITANVLQSQLLTLN